MEQIIILLQREDLQKIIVDCVSSCLKQHEESKLPPPLTDQWFDINQLIEYLPDKPIKTTVYRWVHYSLIPYHKKSKLYFLKSEIDLWLSEGRRKTAAEISAQAEDFLADSKRKVKRTSNSI